MMPILNIAGYKFIELTDLPSLKAALLAKCIELDLKGTILLSPEGINLGLAGLADNISAFIEALHLDSRFSDMTYRKSQSTFQPFQRMKVKIKKEIITFRKEGVEPNTVRAPSISPQEFKQWLDEKRDITILDTRNDYEVEAGTFVGATHFNIKDFCQFPEVVKTVSRAKPVVMFCTGGIRCEKAALYMMSEGYNNVYQLEGGILNYFALAGQTHYQGKCFVFDERVAVDANLFSDR